MVTHSNTSRPVQCLSMAEHSMSVAVPLERAYLEVDSLERSIICKQNNNTCHDRDCWTINKTCTQSKAEECIRIFHYQKNRRSLGDLGIYTNSQLSTAVGKFVWRFHPKVHPLKWISRS